VSRDKYPTEILGGLPWVQATQDFENHLQGPRQPLAYSGCLLLHRLGADYANVFRISLASASAPRSFAWRIVANRQYELNSSAACQPLCLATASMK
jgi:hypothetical protein